MATHGKSTVILVNAGNLTNYFNHMDIQSQVDSNDTTVFGQNSKTSIAGLKNGTMSLQGLWDGTSTGIDAILTPYLGSASDQVVSTAGAGFGIGNRVNLLTSVATSYKTTSVVTDVTKIQADFVADGGIDNGQSLNDLLPSETVTGSNAFCDCGAASSNGGVGHFHSPVTPTGTTPTLTSKIQHSVDNVTYVDLLTFAAQTTTTGSDRQVVAPGTTVNRYLRETHTIGGTGSPTYSYVVAFARR